MTSIANLYYSCAMLSYYFYFTFLKPIYFSQVTMSLLEQKHTQTDTHTIYLDSFSQRLILACFHGFYPGLELDRHLGRTLPVRAPAVWRARSRATTTVV